MRMQVQIVMKSWKRNASLLIFLFCSGCGYSSPQNQFDNQVAVVSVPLIRGDESGDLRDSLAKELSELSGYRYSSDSDARYRLDVKILGDTKETIGYVWDEAPITGAFIKRLYPNEGRRKLTVSISLYDTVKKKIVISPFDVEGFSEYDFVNPTALNVVEFIDLAGNVESVLQFSLGQLDSEEGARLESFQPLSQTLASQVAQALIRAPVKR